MHDLFKLKGQIIDPKYKRQISVIVQGVIHLVRTEVACQAKVINYQLFYSSDIQYSIFQIVISNVTDLLISSLSDLHPMQNQKELEIFSKLEITGRSSSSSFV